MSNAKPSIHKRAKDYMRGKRVMVTGVCGTIGQEIARQLLDGFQVSALIGLDHNESELAFLEERYSGNKQARFLLGDVRDQVAMTRLTRKVDVLFHAAAYKHVHICERSPLEAIQTNVLGMQNIIQSAIENEVGRLVFTSSDKAVNPTNVMGTSKLMGERLVTAAAIDQNHSGSVLLSARFGNVLGSRGSVIPIFREQIRNGGPVTLTDPEMTRFIMSLDDAVHQVIDATVLGMAGDVIITKMAAIRIADLAKVMIREFAPLCNRRPQDIKIREIGQKPGEKLFEELMNEEETRRSLELDRYFVVRPALAVPAAKTPRYPGLIKGTVEQPYSSANVTPMTESEIAAFLHAHGLIHGGKPGTGR